MSFANIGMPSGGNSSSGGGDNNKRMAEPLLLASAGDASATEDTFADNGTAVGAVGPARPSESAVTSAVRAAAAVFGGSATASGPDGLGGAAAVTSSSIRAPPPPGAFDAKHNSTSTTSTATSTAKYAPPVLQLSHYDDADNDEEQQIDFDSGHPHGQSDLMQYTTQHSDLDSALLTERNTEIAHVHKSMSQISEIQRDLATLVDQQQEDIHVIETNAQDTADYADRARNELEKAYAVWRELNRRQRLVLKVLGSIALLWIMVHHLHHARREAASGGEDGAGNGEDGGM